jgi:hypothetical protein
MDKGLYKLFLIIALSLMLFFFMLGQYASYRWGYKAGYDIGVSNTNRWWQQALYEEAMKQSIREKADEQSMFNFNSRVNDVNNISII